MWKIFRDAILVRCMILANSWWMFSRTFKTVGWARVGRGMCSTNRKVSKQRVKCSWTVLNLPRTISSSVDRIPQLWCFALRFSLEHNNSLPTRTLRSQRRHWVGAFWSWKHHPICPLPNPMHLLSPDIISLVPSIFYILVFYFYHHVWKRFWWYRISGFLYVFLFVLYVTLSLTNISCHFHFNFLSFHVISIVVIWIRKALMIWFVTEDPRFHFSSTFLLESSPVPC